MSMNSALDNASRDYLLSLQRSHENLLNTIMTAQTILRQDRVFIGSMMDIELTNAIKKAEAVDKGER